jgi:hypothetical protein
VYRFRLYDIGADENRTSRRWATLEAIAQIRGEALMETATEVDADRITGRAYVCTVGRHLCKDTEPLVMFVRLT